MSAVAPGGCGGLWSRAGANRTEHASVSGGEVYATHCAICHGRDGRGDGEAAARFTIAPRDFTVAQYRFRSTASGKLPTDDDLRRSIVRGMGGTAMVRQDHLSADEVDAVMTFIKALSPRFAAEPVPRPLKLPERTPKTDTSLTRGRRIYDDAGCDNCHGEDGRGTGKSASDLSLPPADLTRQPLKGGSTAEDIVRAVVTGLNGTPMPSYHLLYDDRDFWDLAYFVESLGRPQAGMTDEERLGWEVERRSPLLP
jgi:cytochrome c oxidase cbb3-type subunit 2